MNTARLYTRNGAFVTDFPMIPFRLTPEVVIFGSRVFILRDPFDQTVGSPAAPEYYEACAWSADASKVLYQPELMEAVGK